MARKPESVFYTAIHKLLPVEVHREKMSNPYSSGTADCWYSGRAADLWVEYKFLPALPVRATTMLRLDLSDLQQDWLRHRFDEGRHVAVILGLPGRLGGAIFTDRDWEHAFNRSDLEARLQSRVELARMIEAHTLRGQYVYENQTRDCGSQIRV